MVRRRRRRGGRWSGRRPGRVGIDRRRVEPCRCPVGRLARLEPRNPGAGLPAGGGVARLMPAEVAPDELPTLEMSPDGTLTGHVARVLAGDRAHRFLVLAGTPNGSELRLVE